MEGQMFEKQMFSTNRRDRVFNVRKVPYKEYDHEKYVKANYSPMQKRERMQEPSNTLPKKSQYVPLAITSSAYKELAKKYQAMREENSAEKEKRMLRLKEKEEELAKFRQAREKLQGERVALHQRRDDLRMRIQQLRERNESLRQQRARRNQPVQALNIEDLREMILAMRYQNGLQIDIDNMTYEQLLELQQKMGSVSKGITAEQFQQLEKVKGQAVEGELCSICYCNILVQDEVNRLPCQHLFHIDCIKQWLSKEKTCPLCKQELQRA